MGTAAPEGDGKAFVSWLGENVGPLGGALLSDRVYAIFRKAILSQEISTGQRIVESEIARRLGVSQAPVRDALKRLSHEGIITHIPRRGYFVTEVSESDAKKARVVREMLERLAGSVAADEMTAGFAERLRELIGQMRDAALAGDIPAFRTSDVAFHRAVVEVADNIFLTRMWGVLEPSLQTLRAISDPLFEGSWLTMANNHEVLLDILLTGDAERAGQAFADHAAGRGNEIDIMRQATLG